MDNDEGQVYFTRTGNVVYVLISGGTKRGQERDIAKAQEMAQILNARMEK